MQSRVTEYLPKQGSSNKKIEGTQMPGSKKSENKGEAAAAQKWSRATNGDKTAGEGKSLLFCVGTVGTAT